MEESLKVFDIEDMLASFLEAMGVESRTFPSSAEVVSGRPVGRSAGKTVRGMWE